MGSEMCIRDSLKRTGVRERHIVEKNVASSDLGKEAASIALAKAGIKAEQLDFIVVATTTPDMFFPSTACLLQDKL